MNAFKNILNFLNVNPNKNHEISQEGFCPNCWGRQEYDGQIYQAIKSENTESKKYKSGWITNYTEKNLRGIQLHATEKKRGCKVCFESY